MSESKFSKLGSSFKSQLKAESLTEARSDVLAKLKCKECGGFLSSPPVYLTKDGAGICGKCNPDEDACRNTHFEALAEMISFPCSNQKHGCRKTISFLDKNHETACEFRQYVCPLTTTNSCEWLGPGYHLQEHCTSKHREIILTNPCTLQHDVEVNSIKNYLMLAYKMLFLIQTKICIKSKKIYHSIRLIGDPKKAELFNFNLDIENKGVLLNKTGVVVEQGCMTIQEKFCTTVGFNTIQEFLGSFAGTVYKIKLNKLTENTKCSNCHTSVEISTSNNNKKNYCQTCLKAEINCENHPFGCPYKDILTKTEKHKRYFCLYTTKCLICKKEITQPLEKHYLDKNYYRAGSVFQAQKENLLQWCVVQSSVGILICAYRTMESVFKFYVCSPLPSNKLNDYRCFLILSNPENGTDVAKEMDVKLDEIFDWKIQISDQDFENIVGDGVFNVTLELTNTLYDSE